MTKPLCCIKECEKESHSMGLCTKHWRRNNKYGSPVAMKSLSGLLRGLSAPDRFNRQVKKGDGCWKWTSSVDRDGYGLFRGVVGDTPYLKAHRWSYAFHKGPIPKDMMVCHRCDNPSCVNPEHLFLGTGSDNQTDKWQKGRGRVAFGENAGKAILTEDQALAVLQDHRPYTQIAADYNIAASTVGSIKQRISWRHLQINKEQ